MEDSKQNANNSSQEHADYSEPEHGCVAQPQQEQKQEPVQAPNDKFLNFSKKVSSSTQKIVEESYKKARNKFGTWNFNPRISIDFLDAFLCWTRNMFPTEKFEVLSSHCVRYGHSAMVVAQVLVMLFYLVAAVKLSIGLYILCGIGFAIFLAILQYTADKFFQAGQKLIESSPSKLGSPAFPDCLALLMEVTGIMIFLKFALDARMYHQWNLALVGIGIWALCEAVAYVALNPKMINISISTDAKAGEEAIGILSFFVKALVKIVPIAFGIGSVIGSVALFIAIFTPMQDGLPVAGKAALSLIITCACLPFASYVIFAFYHLVLDILQAILNKKTV